MNTVTDTDVAQFKRACRLDRRLRAVAQMVDGYVELVRPSDAMCTGCLWERVIKPLVQPFIGWERGYALPPATEPLGWSTPVDLSPLLASDLEDNRAARSSATTDDEKWLRGSEAYDAYTDVLLHRLDEADPGNGHGVAKRARRSKAGA